MGNYKRHEEYNEEATQKMAAFNKEILKIIGENPEREGLLKTPERVAKSMQYLTKGTMKIRMKLCNRQFSTKTTMR